MRHIQRRTASPNLATSAGSCRAASPLTITQAHHHSSGWVRVRQSWGTCCSITQMLAKTLPGRPTQPPLWLINPPGQRDNTHRLIRMRWCDDQGHGEGFSEETALSELVIRNWAHAWVSVSECDGMHLLVCGRQRQRERENLSLVVVYGEKERNQDRTRAIKNVCCENRREVWPIWPMFFSPLWSCG